MKKSYVLTFAAGVLACIHVSNAAPPSKTDVIQCNIDAGKRPDEERNAFVEGCLTLKYAVREAEDNAASGQAITDKWCRRQAEGKKETVRKAFIEGCLKAKTDMKGNSTSAAQKNNGH